jgi:hypothetical protein
MPTVNKTALVRAALLCPWLALSGCATQVNGKYQTVAVKTVTGGTDLPGAKCIVANNKGAWNVTTPGTVAIHRSFDDVSVRCTHDGYLAGADSAPSTTTALEWGNVPTLFIGSIVDVKSGAAYEYPNLLVLELQPAPKN